MAPSPSEPLVNGLEDALGWTKSDKDREGVLEVPAAARVRAGTPCGRGETPLGPVDLRVLRRSIVRDVASEKRAGKGGVACTRNGCVTGCRAVKVQRLGRVLVPILDTPHPFEDPGGRDVKSGSAGPSSLPQGTRFDGLGERQGLRPGRQCLLAGSYGARMHDVAGFRGQRSGVPLAAGDMGVTRAAAGLEAAENGRENEDAVTQSRRASRRAWAGA